MPYVGADGKVQEERSPWRFSIITDIIGGIYDFVALFFRAVLNPPQLEQQVSFSNMNIDRKNSSFFIVTNVCHMVIRSKINSHIFIANRTDQQLTVKDNLHNAPPVAAAAVVDAEVMFEA